MNWNTRCLNALTEAGLFEDSAHRTRFKELMDCYSGEAFFTKGICKCMYLSAWDDEHFMILLETLSNMSLGKEQNTREMEAIGDSLAEEQTDDESYIYRLSISYLENSEFYIDEDVNLSDRTAYLIQRAGKAAAIIDNL